MAYASDFLLDLALAELDTEANRLDICSQEPITYTEATSTYTLGNKTSISVGSPEDGDTSGRKVVMATFSDGSVTATGTASHWAISDTVDSRLLLTGSLSSSQAVTIGNTFSLPATDILEINDPT